MAEEKSGQRILVVDDESSISDLIATSLKFVGFEVRTAATGSQALTIAEEFKPHAMILDVMLPDLDGFEVCRKIRNEGIEVGVLFLSAKDEMKDKVQGLTIGGDDYMTKPFQIEELMARLEVIVARRQPKRQSILSMANLQMMLPEEVVHVDGNYVSVPRREAALLCILMRRKGRVVLKSAIEEQLFSPDQELGSNAVEVYVHRLRRRLQETGATVSLHTVRGVGYCLKDETADRQ